MAGRSQISTTYTPTDTDDDFFDSAVTGAGPWVPAINTETDDGLAHKVTILNNSVTDHSGKTVTITGTDRDGNAQTETIAAPGSSATVTSTKYYLTWTLATVSSTIGADTFDLGLAAVAQSPSFQPFANNKVTAGVAVTGTIDYDIAFSLTSGADNDIYTHLDADGKTANAYAEIITPVHGVFVIVNSFTAGATFTLECKAGQS